MMTPAEVVDTALAVNLGSIPLSLAAVYAVLGDKFIRPAVDRADTITSRLRGEVSNLLADAARPFTSLDNATVARVSLVGLTGEPLEQANISRVPLVDSETFREAMRACLDARSATFDNYWRSTLVSIKMKLLLRLVRLALCVWPGLAIAGATYFGLVKHDVMESPPMYWLGGAAAVTVLPLIVFVFAMPMMSHYANCIDRFESRWL